MSQEGLKQRFVELLIKAEDNCESTMSCKNCVGYGKGADCRAYMFADYLVENGATIRERGKWTFACVHNGKKFYKCSNCWHAFPSVDKESCEETCPHCGADMRGVKDE